MIERLSVGALVLAIIYQSMGIYRHIHWFRKHSQGRSK